MDDPATVAVTLADLIGGDAGAIEAKLRAGARPVVLGSPGDAETRANVELAISDGTLPGIAISEVARVAVATTEGVTFVDPASGAIILTVPETGGAHGLALVTGLDDPKLYATVGAADDPDYDVIVVGGDGAKDGPVSMGQQPVAGARHGRDLRQRQPAGPHPRAGARAPARRVRGRSTWSQPVGNPHANAVYADARLPDGFVPVSVATDLEPDYPSEDRQQLLVFTSTGASASIDVGSHAFAWRFPGSSPAP